MSKIKPFTVSWSEAEVAAVLGRVRAYPWPPIPQVPDGWAYGCDGAYLKALCDHWTEAYDSYLAQGGDWGAMVTSWLARDHGAHAKAIHLNMLGFRPHGGPQGEAEVAWATRQAGAMDVMGAYFRLQVSKPQSIAWMGAGNPVGQAAWITERFHDWSDLSNKSLDEAYGKDRLITNIMLYVMTDSFATG